MVYNPEIIIQGLLGLQLAWHQQAFLQRGWTPPPQLETSWGGDCGLEPSLG